LLLSEWTVSALGGALLGLIFAVTVSVASLTYAVVMRLSHRSCCCTANRHGDMATLRSKEMT